MKSVHKFGLLTVKSNFKPKLISQLGEGGQAKVFKGTFHGKDVAMKYIPLDTVRDEYRYIRYSYGCEEFYYQEKFQRTAISYCRYGSSTKNCYVLSYSP